MTETDRQAVLVIDDDDVYRTRLGRAFELRGWEAHPAATGAQALAIARESAPDLATVDLRLEGESGIDVVRALRELDATITILMLTGYGSIATAVEAVREGAVGYLPKPADADEIIAALAGTNTAKEKGIETPSLARAEWEHIQRVLSDCGGNISEAARRLGIHRRSLQRKLHKYPPTR